MKKDSGALKSLQKLIWQKITIRIFISIILIFFVGLLLSLYDAHSYINSMKQDTLSKVEPLSNFIISQVIISNPRSIETAIKEFNLENKNIRVAWIKASNPKDGFNLSMKPSPALIYEYPIQKIDNYDVGYLLVSRPIFKNPGIFTGLLNQTLSIFIFSCIIIFLLYPLSKKIPHDLFITPINDLLLLLKEKKSPRTYIDSDFPKELMDVQKKILALLQETDKNSKKIALGEVATQVAHDIRSPLLVLKTVLNDLSHLPEKKRVDVRNAIQRVTDIANNLLTQYRHDKHEAELRPSPEPIAMLLESIVSEKRLQNSEFGLEISLDLSQEAHTAFAEVDIEGFKRVLSNLMNNAVEAVRDKKGHVHILLNKIDEKIHIQVKDNGLGIPKDKLKTLLEKGGSFGKTEGSGLGLPYAFHKIISWQGTYTVNSTPENGTCFDIFLPAVSAPAWFQQEITLHENAQILVLDDDDYIHQIWNQRFPEDFLKRYSLTLHHFNKPQDLLLFCETHALKNTLFLLDYELKGFKETGPSLAEQLHVGPQANLITSRYEDLDIRAKCQSLGMKIIPKYLAAQTPIRVLNKATPAPMVFIDDEPLICECWENSAKAAGKILDTYTDAEILLSKLSQYPKETLFYLDASLGKTRGEDLAKILYDKGYREIIFATGYPKAHFKHLTFIKDVIGKEPPWGIV